MADVVELEVPARPDYLALARLIVAAAAANRSSAVSEDRIDDLRLAVSEACTNAIEAQQRATELTGRQSNILIRCRVETGQVEVEIHDHGVGFDPTRLAKHPPVTDPARLDHERGLGIPLIRLLTDEVDFEPSVDGTVVRMTVYANTVRGNGSALSVVDD
jgi:serine/threonine-protein kinase RsbW